MTDTEKAPSLREAAEAIQASHERECFCTEVHMVGGKTCAYCMIRQALAAAEGEEAKVRELVEKQLATARRDALLEAAESVEMPHYADADDVRAWLRHMADAEQPTDERVDKVWP